MRAVDGKMVSRFCGVSLLLVVSKLFYEGLIKGEVLLVASRGSFSIENSGQVCF